MALAQAEIRRDPGRAHPGLEYAQIARDLKALRPWAKRNLATYGDRREFFEGLLERSLR